MLSLSQIQFVFDNGTASPWCSADGAREAETLVSVDIDHRKRITGIQARVYERDGKMEGLRLIDEDGAYQLDETWYTFAEPEPWGEVLPVPADAQIIGFKCETGGYEINRLAFQLW